jgi:hypothetical protein
MRTCGLTTFAFMTNPVIGSLTVLLGRSSIYEARYCLLLDA